MERPFDSALRTVKSESSRSSPMKFPPFEASRTSSPFPIMQHRDRFFPGSNIGATAGAVLIAHFSRAEKALIAKSSLSKTDYSIGSDLDCKRKAFCLLKTLCIPQAAILRMYADRLASRFHDGDGSRGRPSLELLDSPAKRSIPRSRDRERERRSLGVCPGIPAKCA